MLKIGEVSFKSEIGEEKYYVFYSSNIGFERIDVWDDMDLFDDYNTRDSIASYISRRKEYFYGREALILKIQKLINSCATMAGTRKNDFSSEYGSLLFTVTKEDAKAGILNVTKTENGSIKEEIYKDEDSYMHFMSIDSANELHEPFNMNEYSQYTLSEELEGFDSFSDADYHSLDYIKAKYQGKLDHMNNYDFVVVDSMESYRERIDEWIESNSSYKAVDTESTGLDVGLFGEDCMTGIVLSFNETQSTYFPFRQEGCEFNLPIKYVQEIVDSINNQPKRVKICGYNNRFDKQVILKEQWQFIQHCKYAMQWDKTPCKNNNNMRMRMDVDGFHMSIKLDQRRGRGIHALKTVSKKISGLFWLELEEIFKGKIRFNVLPPELIIYYACPDTCNTIRVVKHYEAMFPPGEIAVLQLEDELVDSVVDCEFFGLNTDVDRLGELITDSEYNCDKLEKEFKNIHNISSNIRSYQTKADIFYNKLRAKVDVRTKTGAPSASAVALKRILERGALPKDKIKEPYPPSIVGREKRRVKEGTQGEEVYREEILSGKVLSSNKYPSLIILDKYNKTRKELGALRRIRNRSVRGRTKFYLNSDGADSDRMTSDAHQYSNTMKSVVVSDSKKHKLVSCDWAQVELRILAFEAGEKALMEMMDNPFIDVHRAFLHSINGTPLHLITEEDRKNGKSTNFGIVYGMSQFGLANSRKGPAYTTKDVVVAEGDIVDFYNALPGIKQFTMDSERDVLRDKKIRTSFGFIRYFDYLNDPGVTKKQISKAIKAGNNTRIQGFGATMLKIAMTNYHKYIHERGWDEVKDYDGVPLPMVRVMLPIHDELLISYDDSIRVEEILIMCKECQELEIKGAPHFFAPPAVVDNWYSGKSSAYEIPIPFRDEIIEKYNKNPNEVVLDTDRYLECLTNYRNSILKDYMDGLIAKYKTIDEVAKHVDHPDLTHTLISMKMPESEEKARIPDQLDRIRLSVERYMKGIEVENKEEESSVFKYLEEEEMITEFIRFDANGEQLIEHLDGEEHEDEEEDNEADIFNFSEYIPDELKHVDKEWVVYAKSECIIFFYDINIANEGEIVHQNLSKYFNKGGPYKVIYCLNGKMTPTPYTVGYIPREINFEFTKALLKEVV